MIEAKIESGCVTIDSQQIDKPIYLTVEEAEQLWQDLLNICHEYRRQEQIAKVNN